MTKNIETVRSLLQRALTEKAGGKPTKLARLIGYNYASVANTLAGRRALPLPYVINLCKLYGRDDAVELDAAQRVERPKRVNDRVRRLLRLAIKTKAEGKPEQMAELIGYEYTSFLEVMAGFRKLPVRQMNAFCKLAGRSDAAELHAHQSLD